MGEDFEAHLQGPVVRAGHRILRKGDRIQLILPRFGIPVRGTVFHVDASQILVKWDDGRSESLRAHFADRFRIVEDEPS